MLTSLVAATVIALTGAQEAKGPVETGMSWLRSAWSSVEKQGRPAAEKAIKEMPKFFSGLPKRVTQMTDKAAKVYKDMKLEDKKAFVLELWRVRQSLNLMALLDPEVLQNLTGIDAKVLKTAMDTANKLYAQLTK